MTPEIAVETAFDVGFCMDRIMAHVEGYKIIHEY
jgi:hypothetical protein